ncbi:MAG: hypothetical protein D6718_02240 [Acidobacteria bacterium]|nr:MAG: hypothetical protein D6718_02240 [Acidobacteriota bacterium]
MPRRRAARRRSDRGYDSRREVRIAGRTADAPKGAIGRAGSAAVLGAAVALAATAAAGTAVDLDLVEHARAERVVWPVVFEEKAPGACEGLKPEDVEVVESGGGPLPVEAIERRRMPTVHAVLVDLSESHAPVADAVKQALARYLGWVREGDAVLVAHFADELHLDRPLTPKQAGAPPRPPQDLGLGGLTALWDAIDETLAYLRGLPERKVLLLISDGCESASLLRAASGGDDEPLRAAIDATHGLVAFAIGIDTPVRCQGVSPPLLTSPRDFFYGLAERTGGDFFDLHYRNDPAAFGRELDQALGEIARRLENEGAVIYIPLAEEAGERPPRERRVEVRLSRAARRRLGGRCHLRAAVGRRRPRGQGEPTAGGEPLPLTAEGLVDTSRLGAWHAGSSFSFPQPRAARMIAERSLATGPDGVRKSPPARAELRSGGIVLHALDVTGDVGMLVALGKEGGRARLVERRNPQAAERTVRIAVPPFDRLRSEISAPELALLALAREPEAPVLVNGKLLFDLRPWIARALLAVPGYREWALERLRARRRKEIAFRLGGLIGRLERERAAALLDRLSRDIPPGPVPAVLADWLGDLSARELARRLDVRGANLLLVPGPPGAKARDWAERIERAWPRFASWFGPAIRTRSVLLPIPVMDRRRERIGFFRVFLPHEPARDGSLADAWPPHPLAIDLVRRLVRRAGEELRGRVWVASMRAGPISGFDRRKLRGRICRAARDDPALAALCDALPERPVVARLVFADRQRPEGRAELAALYDTARTGAEEAAENAPALLCAWPPSAVSGASAREASLAARLASSLPEDRPRCPAGSLSP